MPAEVLTELVRVGILGPIVIALGWFVWQQHKTIEALHASNAQEVQKMHMARMAETQVFIERLFALNDAWQKVLRANSDLLSNTVSTLGSVRETMGAADVTLAELSKQMYALLNTTNRAGF